MTRVLSFSSDDPTWKTVSLLQKNIKKHGKMYIVLRFDDNYGFVVFDVLDDTKKKSKRNTLSKTQNELYYIPSSFPFMLPLYRTTTLYVTKVLLPKTVYTGWLDDNTLSWSNVTMKDVADDDILSIQSKWHGISIREAMAIVLQNDWKDICIERDEDTLVGINIVETYDDDEDNDDYGAYIDEDMIHEETIDDWLEDDPYEEEEDDDDGEIDDDDEEIDDDDGDIDDDGDVEINISIDDGLDSDDDYYDNDDVE